MCDEVQRAVSGLPETDRRNFLRLMGAGLGAAAVSGVVAASPAAGASREVTFAGRKKSRTRIVLLGTAGGPQLVPGDRTGVSTAIVYDDRYYLIDVGWGATVRIVQAGLGSNASGTFMALNNLSAVLLTHMHSDHLAEWPALYMTGAANTLGRTLGPIQVFGPPDRQQLPLMNPPARPAPPVVDPDNPGRGISSFTSQFRLANSADFNDRMRDQGQKDPASVFAVTDIDLRGAVIGSDGIPPRLNGSLPVWTDGDVRITATLVDHRPTAPALAYRFDTPDGSVVVSGDTTVSANLIDLAADCDYLVHEVIDVAFVDRIVSALPPEVGGPLKKHLLASHTTIQQVGKEVAEPARAKNLVLTHMNPGTTKREWKAAKVGYSGNLIVGSDLLEIPVGR